MRIKAFALILFEWKSNPDSVDPLQKAAGLANLEDPSKPVKLQKHIFRQLFFGFQRVSIGAIGND
jgi:hypothetical protein